MKTFKSLVIIGIAALMVSCASTAKFPVSNTVPAAEITATKKQDKNNNYTIELNAKNLAEASRVDPKMTNYSVWVVVENGTTKNIGQLINKNGGRASLKTVTPYDVQEIFVTAEAQGDLSYPEGIEITRTRFAR